jgi:DNA-binding winged helix-turn-helix (wHTH) protein
MTSKLAKLILVTAIGLILVACGSDPDDVPSLRTTGDTQVPESTADAADKVRDNEAAMMAFTQCLRDQGIEVYDPVVDSEGNVQKPQLAEGVGAKTEKCVTKPFHPGELLARIRAVLRRIRGGSTASRVIRAGDLKIDVDAHRVEVRGETVPLTPTEFGLLRALAEHRGQALTRPELIEKGLGYSYEGIERTVDSHIRNLRRKLAEAGAREDLVETVFGVGYRVPFGSAGADASPTSNGPAAGGDS